MMERLTERDDMGCAWYKTTEAPSHQRIEAHAAYEDTGLTPDEIAALRAENERTYSALKLAQARAADYEADIEAILGETWVARGLRDLVLRRISDIPTVAAEPVRHACWITHYLNSHTCSACNWEVEDKHRFCPNCGARMDAEQFVDTNKTLDAKEDA